MYWQMFKMKNIIGNLELFALRDIQEDEEIIYLYGLPDLPCSLVSASSFKAQVNAQEGSLRSTGIDDCMDEEWKTAVKDIMTFSNIEMCSKKFYLYEGVCKPCPAHCDICINATHCTLCQKGYYGQICENECEVGCTGTCHKVFGHCTYGCEDGTYPEDNSLACLDCPKECELCRSMAVCVTCQPGYYGESCRKKCSGLCKEGLCNTTDGTCFECNDGSYTVDRVCILCPDGCAQCNESHKCTLCNDGFIGPIHGCCFLECPNIKEENFSVCNICLNETGSICNISLCRNLPPYWKLQRSKCHQAISFPFHYNTEGICVTSNDSLHTLTMELTSYSDLEYSLNYMTFKCSLECKGHTTGYMMEPCEERLCKVACELAETANTVETESWESSTCSLDTSRDNTGLVLPNKAIAVSVALSLLGICIVIVALVTLCRKNHELRLMISRWRLFTMKPSSRKGKSNEDTAADDIPGNVSEDLSAEKLNVDIRHENHGLRQMSSMWRGFPIKPSSRKGKSNEDTEADDITGNVSEDLSAAELNVDIRPEIAIEAAEHTRFMYK